MKIFVNEEIYSIGESLRVRFYNSDTLLPVCTTDNNGYKEIGRILGQKIGLLAIENERQLHKGYTLRWSKKQRIILNREIKCLTVNFVTELHDILSEGWINLVIRLRNPLVVDSCKLVRVGMLSLSGIKRSGVVYSRKKEILSNVKQLFQCGYLVSLSSCVPAIVCACPQSLSDIESVGLGAENGRI